MRSAVLGLGLLLAACNRTPGREGDQEGECDDEFDNDADGKVDCDDPGCRAAPACTGDDGDDDPDADGDGFPVSEDCDDADPEVNPVAEEIVWDGVDNDCDEATPDDDLDGDGAGVATDCDEGDAATAADAALQCHSIGAADLRIEGTDRGGDLGASIAWAEDGGSLLVGAPGLEGDAGAVLVYPADALIAGHTLGVSDASARLDGARAFDRLGAEGSLVPLPDGALLLGSPTWDPGGFSNAGVAFVLDAAEPSGTGSAEAAARIQLQGRANGDRFGERLGHGDVDGDGLADLFITASGDDTAYDNSGLLAVFTGSSLTDGTRSVEDADARLTGGFNERMGKGRPTLIGDLNGDGLSDLAIGSSGSSAAGLTGNGVVYLISADDVADGAVLSASWARLTGAAEGDLFGAELAAPGDLDGDGRAEIAVAALRGEVGQTNEGTVHFWWGDAPLGGTVSTSTSDLTWTGGTGLARAGDGLQSVEGDLLLGVPYRNGSSRAYVLAGADAARWSGGDPSLDASTWVTAATPAAPLDAIALAANGAVAAGLPTTEVARRTEAGTVHVFLP